MTRNNQVCENCGSTEFHVIDSEMICVNCQAVYADKQAIMGEIPDDHNIGEARLPLGGKKVKLFKDKKRQGFLDRKTYRETRDQRASYDFERMVDELYRGLPQLTRQNMIDDCKDLQTKTDKKRSGTNYNHLLIVCVWQMGKLHQRYKDLFDVCKSRMKLELAIDSNMSNKDLKRNKSTDYQTLKKMEKKSNRLFIKLKTGDDTGDDWSPRDSTRNNWHGTEEVPRNWLTANLSKAIARTEKPVDMSHAVRYEKKVQDIHTKAVKILEDAMEKGMIIGKHPFAFAGAVLYYTMMKYGFNWPGLQRKIASTAGVNPMCIRENYQKLMQEFGGNVAQ